MTGIGLGYAMLLLVVGQANQQQLQRDDEGEQFIAAEPVLHIISDDAPAEAKSKAKTKPKFTAKPLFQQQPKIVAPRLIAASKKTVVPEGKMPDRKVIRIKHAPVVDVADAINELLRAERKANEADDHAVVVADPVSNTLLISATPNLVDQIELLVTALDRKPPLIRVDAALVQVTREATAEKAQVGSASHTWKEGISAALEELGQRGHVRVLARPTVLAVDNQAAFVQVGRREPRLTGMRESSQGRLNSMELENVGLILGVTARANDEDWITMEIDLEDSRLGAQEQGAVIATTSDGEVIRSPGVDVATMQTTICVRSGHAVTAGCVVEQRDDRYGEFWMIVEARLVEQAE